MNTLSSLYVRFQPEFRSVVRVMFLVVAWSFAGLLSVNAQPGGAPEGGRIAGRVQHAVTDLFLNGALVELPDLGRSTLTDQLGRFEFRNLPAGTVTVVVSYIGLDPERRTVSVGAPDSTGLVFAMQSEVLQLETFQVTTEAEGNAAVITRQRNSPNLITTAATDAFGALASQNPGEVFMRLPGVAATIGDDTEPVSISVRGMASRLNAVTSDGGMVASVNSNATRGVTFGTQSTAQYEEFEVVKGIRPDMEASSIGGTLNMRTKSPLSTRRNHDIRYKIGARWAPPFTPHNPIRRENPLHSDLAFGYVGVFDAFGGKRNLGVSLNSTYFESAGDWSRTIRDYEFTTNPRAYVYDYRVADYFNNRVLKTISGRVDYQFTEGTLISLRAAINDYDTWGNHVLNQVRAFTNRTVAALDSNGNPTGSGTILPDYTEHRTEVRPLAASRFELTAQSIGQLQKRRSFQVVLEHRNDALEVDVNLNYALGRLQQLSGQDHGIKMGGTFVTTVPGVGYVIDMGSSKEYPSFTQTAGPSVYDINNYGSKTLTLFGYKRDARIYSGKADVKYNLKLDNPTYLKAGLNMRRQETELETFDDRQVTFVGADRVAGTPDDSLEPFISTRPWSSEFGMGGIPQLNIERISKHYYDNPGQWNENVYYRESRRYANTNLVKEDVGAAYLMASTRIGKLNVLGGSRYERTEVGSRAWVIQRTRTDITDPVLRAATEYSLRRIKGSYDHLVSSLHLTYSFNSHLIARASYSEGLGRPEFSNLVPTENVNDTQQTITISNPSLLPQSAKNWDFSLEYYIKPMGFVSAGVFQKDLRDFIFSSSGGVVGTGPDNGFGGDYAGYTINTTLNGGAARVRGIELGYQQQLSFGPDWVRRFWVMANYTRLESSGDYGTGSDSGANMLAEFIPETWNFGVRFSRGKFRASYLVNHTGEYLFTYSPDPARLRFKKAFTNTTISASWAFSPKVELYVDGYNVFNKSQGFYYGIKEHLQSYSTKGMIVSFGVRGRF